MISWKFEADHRGTHTHTHPHTLRQCSAIVSFWELLAASLCHAKIIRIFNLLRSQEMQNRLSRGGQRNPTIRHMAQLNELSYHMSAHGYNQITLWLAGEKNHNLGANLQQFSLLHTTLPSPLLICKTKFTKRKPAKLCSQ